MFSNTSRGTFVVLLALAWFSLFSGCAPQHAGVPAAPASASGTAAADTRTSDAAPYSIRWYTIGTPQKDIPMVMDKLSEYTLRTMNARVDMVQYGWGEYNDKIQLVIRSGEPFDICFSSSGVNDYFQNAAKGAFLPLDDLLAQYGKGILEQEHPMFLDAVRIKGRIYGIPANKELGCVTVWAFNKNLVDQYALDLSAVKGIETLKPLLEKVKAQTGNTIPDLFAVNANSGIPNAGLIDYPTGESSCIGIRMDKTDKRLIDVYEDPEVISTLRWLRDFYLSGYIRSDAALSTSTDYYKTGRFLVKQDGWVPGADELWSRSAGCPIVSVPVYDKLYISNSGLLGSILCISSTSGNPEKAMTFLNLLNTDRYVRNMVDSGIEGIHYVMRDGRQTDLPGSSNYDMPTYSLGNRYILNSHSDDPYSDMGAQYRKLNNTGLPSPLLGFQTSLGTLTDELVAIESVFHEFTPSLYTGSVDPDVYTPKMIRKLQGAGLERVMNELQGQLDRHCASARN